METAEEAHLEEVIKCLTGVKPVPLVWQDLSKDGYRVFQATTILGQFNYGTDLGNQPYYQSPGKEEDVPTEEEAKLAAEEQYRRMVFRKVAEYVVPAPETNGVSPAVIAELQDMLAKYADGCVDARYWGGPTMYPQNPITENVARRFAELLKR
jgi:hypothetical protein